jgi:N-acetylglucosamine kinase-like BadF-type ATPase
MPEYILALDAGNTKTVALVARRDGVIVGAGRAGCGDIYANPTLGEVDAAVARALSQAGCTAADVEIGAFSMAGADWPEDYAFLQQAFEARGWGRRVIVLHDSIATVWAGARDGVGVAVACGTGVATGARAATGRIWHTSFWQESGGGRHLGDLVMRACVRVELGIDPASTLPGAVARFFGRTTFEDVLHWRYTRDVELGYNLAFDARVLAPVLLDCAADGDAIACAIVEREGRILGDYALAAARKVGLDGEPFPLVMAGGVFRHASRLLPDALIRRVREAAPHAQPIVSRFEPAVGALLCALASHGVPLDGMLIARIETSLPKGDLFRTIQG